MKTSNERLTSNESEEPVVVFLIGMRVNRWWKVRQWLRTALAMPRMLRELAQHPELGMLGGESWFGRTTILVSYWKSVDHLFGYAKLRNAEHLPAWRAFNKLAACGSMSNMNRADCPVLSVETSDCKADSNPGPFNASGSSPTIKFRTSRMTAFKSAIARVSRASAKAGSCFSKLRHSCSPSPIA